MSNFVKCHQWNLLYQLAWLLQLEGSLFLDHSFWCLLGTFYPSTLNFLENPTNDYTPVHVALISSLTVFPDTELRQTFAMWRLWTWSRADTLSSPLLGGLHHKCPRNFNKTTLSASWNWKKKLQVEKVMSFFKHYYWNSVSLYRKLQKIHSLKEILHLRLNNSMICQTVSREHNAAVFLLT